MSESCDSDDNSEIEDLPPIALSLKRKDEAEWVMPPASQLALERAREEGAQRALSDLEEQRAASPLRMRADSVEFAPPEPGRALPPTLELLRATAVCLPSQVDTAFLDTYLQAVQDHQENHDAIDRQVLSGVYEVLAGAASGGLDDSEVLCVGVWLLSMALGAGCRRPATRRALHRLLDQLATEEQVWSLAAAAAEGAAEAGGVSLLLEGADAARSGAGRGADAFASTLLEAVVARLLKDPHQENDTELPKERAGVVGDEDWVSAVRTQWRQLSDARRMLLLRAAGRALVAAGGRAGDGERREELLTALAQPLPRAPAHSADRLQVLTTVSELQLLFGTHADGREGQMAEEVQSDPKLTVELMEGTEDEPVHEPDLKRARTLPAAS